MRIDANFAALLVAGCLGAAPSLRCQQADSTLLRALPVSAGRVRIETAGAHIGRVTNVAADSLTLQERDGARRIAMRDIASVSKEASRAGHGAIVGAITGGALVGALGAFVGQGNRNETVPPQNTGVTGFIGGFLLGAASGALVGGAIGAASHEWRVVWSRR